MNKEEIEKQIGIYQHKQHKMHVTGLVLTIVFAILSVVSLILACVKIMNFAELIYKYQYVIGSGITEEQIAVAVVEYAVWLVIFVVAFVALLAGIALLIVAKVVFGKKAKNQQALLNQETPVAPVEETKQAEENK